MALSDTAIAQMLETFRASGGAELIHEAVELVLQELIEAEATAAIRAGRYERTHSRTTARNGHHGRLLTTRAGDLELKIPKLHRGSFMPSVLEPRRRIDRALYAVIMEVNVAGVSTRSVDDLVAALGAESGISKSEVSRIGAGLDEGVEAFRSRSLDHVEFPDVYLDATYLNVRNSVAQPASMATVVATGITSSEPSSPSPTPTPSPVPGTKVADQLAASFPKAGPLMAGAKPEVLAFCGFPRAHWQKICSTNPLERINKETRHRSRVVGIFPNEASAIRLVGAILADLHDEWQASDRRYLAEDSMSLL